MYRPSFEEKWYKRFTERGQRCEDDAGIAGWSTSGLQTRLRHFASTWHGDVPGALWLDVGCGAGTYTRFLAAQKLRVIGLDYSFPTVKKAKTKGPDKILWGVSDVKKLPLRPDSLDGVLCFGVTQALAASDSAVAEIVQAVRPGGQIWIDALNGWCLPHLWEKLFRKLRGRPLHLRYESPKALTRLLEEEGIAQIRLYWLPILPKRLQKFQWLVENRPAVWILHHCFPLGALLSHAFVLYGEKSKALAEK